MLITVKYRSIVVRVDRGDYNDTVGGTRPLFTRNERWKNISDIEDMKPLLKDPPEYFV